MTLTNILDCGLYIIKDFAISITLIAICIYILKGKFAKHIPTITILSIVNITNALIGIFLISKYTTATSDFEYDEIMDIFSIFIALISVTLLVKEIKFSKKLATYIICVCTVDMIYSILAPFVNDALHTECLIMILFYGGILSFIYYIIKISPVNILPEVFDQIPKWMIVILFIFDFACYYREFGDYNDVYNLVFAISSIGIILCALFFVYKLFSLTYNQNLILKQMHDQKEYSEKMLTGDENLRRFRHDYRNHMIVINSLLESGRTDRAREYLNNMNSDISSTLTKISTGNFISDAIINNKAVAAAEHDVSIKFTGQVIPSGIADEDLCTVLANILDNAIEATQKLSSNRTIRIDAALRNGLFIMNVSNPVETEVKIKKDGTIKTSKKNHSEHGFGIKNVQKAVKKYGGTVSVTCENKVFSVDIMMKPVI